MLDRPLMERKLKAESEAPKFVERPIVDLSCLSCVPPFGRLCECSVVDVLTYLPDGAFGIAGQTVEWSLHMHEDSLVRSAALLTRADQGALPTF